MLYGCVVLRLGVHAARRGMMSYSFNGRDIRKCLTLSATLAALGCPFAALVGIVDGSTIENLRFSIQREGGGEGVELSYFIVDSCDAYFSDTRERLWAIESEEDPVALRELRYGERPRGYREFVLRALRVDQD